MWQRGWLDINDKTDYMYGEDSYEFVTYKGEAYFVSPCIMMVNNGCTCWSLYIYYLVDERKYIKIDSLDCFKAISLK